MNVGALPGVAQQCAVHETARIFRQRQVHADDIRLLDQLLRQTARSRCRSSRPHRRGPTAFSLKRRLHTSTGIPKPRARRATSWPMCPNPRRPSVCPIRPLARAYSFLFHFPARRSATLSANPPIDRQDQRHRQLGHRNGVLARAIRYVDAPLGGARDVDGIDAGAGADNQRQRASIQHGGGHLASIGRRGPAPVNPEWRPRARRRWHRDERARRSRRPSTPRDPTARTCPRPVLSFSDHV